MKKILTLLLLVFCFSAKSQISTATMISNINDTVYQNNGHKVTGAGLNGLLKTMIAYVLGASANVNPTSGFIPYNNSGTFSDSWLSQDANNVFIANSKKLASTNGQSFLNFNTGDLFQLHFNNGTENAYVNGGNTSLQLGFDNGTDNGELVVNATEADITHTKAIELNSGTIMNIDCGTDLTITAGGEASIITPSGAGNDITVSAGDNLLTTSVNDIRFTSGDDVNVIATDRFNIVANGVSATTVPYLDASKNLISSAVTPTQLGYLSGATGTTGTNTTNIVYSTSPTLVTPVLGTPTSGDLSNCTGTYFTLMILSGPLNPADATTYYFSYHNNVAVTSTATDHDWNYGYAFTIIGATIVNGGNTISGTAEDNTLQLRNVTQATSTSIGVFKTNGTTNSIVSSTYTGLSIIVSASDFITMQWDTPTFVTNPTNVRPYITLFCKKN